MAENFEPDTHVGSSLRRESIQGQKPLLYHMKDGKEQLVETHTRVRRRKQPTTAQGTEPKSAARR
jgi:hypothetical protein